MLCPNCETENSEDARLCSECGFPLSGAVARGGGAASFARSTPAYSRPYTPEPTPEPDWESRYRDAPHRSSRRTSSLEEELAAQKTGFSWEPRAKQPFEGFEGEEENIFRQEPASQAAPEDAAPSPETEPFEEYSEYEEYTGFGAQDAFNSFDGFNTFVTGQNAFEPELIGYEAEADYTRPLESGVALDGESALSEPAAGNTLKFDDDDPFFSSNTSGLNLDHTGVMEPFALDGESVQDKARNYRIAPPERRFSGKQIALIVGGIVVIAVAAIAVIGFALGLWGGVAVPNVVGMSQQDAEAALAEKGFTTKVMQVKSDEVEGRVLIMDPGAGTFAEEGSEVIIHVATARTIPNVVGMTLEEAQAALAEAGYTNVKTNVQYTDEEEGIVLSITPDPDSRARSSVEITITISENYRVPDISGMSLEEAQKAIEDAELTPTIMYIDTDQYPDGSVIGTDPEAGTKVSQGAYVAITIARLRGVELVALAEDLIAEGKTIEIGGVNYQIESVSSMSYQGDDIVAFTITAKPFVNFFGETLFASSSQTVTGQISFDSNNQVLGIY